VIVVELSAHDIWFDGRRARLVLAHDVTQQRRLEEHFRQAQKLEAVGRLAGGVAHDFNNLLTVILAECDLAIADGVSRDTTHGSVSEIRKAAERAAMLTRQLLSFSRRQVAEPSSLCVNSVVTDVSTMLTRLIGEDVVLKIHLDPLIGSTRADRGQIEQVLLNLVVNARDAMPAGGTLTRQHL
jgi:signal transduction histidine kinase